MSIELTSFTDVSQSTVDSVSAKITQMIREDHPNLEVQRGVIQSLVIHYMATISAVNQENNDRYRRSASLLEIERDPSLADPEIVDAVLSNFGVSRREGSTAVGIVTIAVDRLSPVTIPSGSIFSADGVEFRSDDSYVARTSIQNVQSDTDRVLVPTGDGNYTFDIQVTAVMPGTSGLLRRSTFLVPTDTIVNYVASYAAADFQGGTDTESNDELLRRMQEGISCQALSNRINMRSLLRSLPGYDTVLHSSIVGFSDPEMLRDRSGLFPFPCGGKVDWYVRTAEYPSQVELRLDAALIDKQADNRGVWQLNIDRDAAAGFYDVFQVRPDNDFNYTGSYSVSEELRDVDASPVSGVAMPHIPDSMHGYFSRYQTATLRFKDTDTPVSDLALGDQRTYTVIVRTMPGIADLQNTIGSIQHRNYGGDVLVKAPVPAMVSLGFTLSIPVGDFIPDATAIKQSIARYINNLGFTGKLYASAITDITHGFLGSRTNISEIDMYAQILAPDGQVLVLRSTSLLELPHLPESLVTKNTCVFMCDPANISVGGEGVEASTSF